MVTVFKQLIYGDCSLICDTTWSPYQHFKPPVRIITRALYGLEAVATKRTGRDKLGSLLKPGTKSRRFALKCILGLQKWTATTALHFLTGHLKLTINYQL